MSSLVVLGALGTLVSTITILPHVSHAVRHGKPGGSPMAWALGALGSAVWVAYSFVAHDLMVGAPGLVTVPCGLLLAVWSARSEFAERALARRVCAEDHIETEIAAWERELAAEQSSVATPEHRPEPAHRLR